MPQFFCGSHFIMASKYSLQTSLELLTRITNETYDPATAPIANALWQQHLHYKNPLWKHLTMKTFVTDNSNGSAHVIAFTDARLPNKGFVGYFGATSPATGAAVLAQANSWLKTKGIHDIYGPINGTITADYRFNLDPDHKIPGEPVNPTWYIDIFHQAGFETFNRYVSGLVKHPQLYIRLAMSKKPTKGYEHIALRPFDPNTKRNIPVYHQLMNAIFPANSIYCPIITLEERTYNIVSSGTLFNPDYCYFAYDGDKAVGFIVAYPYNGNLVLKTVGVLPKYRGKRIANLLVHKVHAQAKKDNLRRAIYSTIRDTTKVYKMKRPGLKIFRHYITMHKTL